MRIYVYNDVALNYS